MANFARFLEYHGPEVIKALERDAAVGLARFGDHAVTRVKAQLYVGHGYRTGALQRSVHRTAVTLNGRKVQIGVRAERTYARYIDKKYDFLNKGMEDAVRTIGSYVSKHV